jgi:hypothetical protein
MTSVSARRVVLVLVTMMTLLAALVRRAPVGGAGASEILHGASEARSRFDGAHSADVVLADGRVLVRSEIGGDPRYPPRETREPSQARDRFELARGPRIDLGARALPAVVTACIATPRLARTAVMPAALDVSPAAAARVRSMVFLS